MDSDSGTRTYDPLGLNVDPVINWELGLKMISGFSYLGISGKTRVNWQHCLGGLLN